MTTAKGKELAVVFWSALLLWLSHSLCFAGSLTQDLFSCRNLSDAHYQYLKPPGDSVTFTCPKNCSSGETRWYHSYVKKPMATTAAAGRGLDLLAWSGSSHEAAVRETPSQGSVGYFCCACEGEEEEDVARDGCCWGVAYQPIVNMTITASQGWTHEDETIAVPGARLSLRCEARGYPNISVSISAPSQANNSSFSVTDYCKEVVRSWYSTVVVCNWTAANETLPTGRFTCNGSILLDTADNKIVPYTITASQQLSMCNVPSLVSFYRTTSLEGPQMDLKCEIDCCRLSTCSVSWYFEGEEIDTRNTRYHTSSEGRGLVHVLSVDEPGMRDFGRYFCVLRSPLREGPDRRTITITVPGGAKPSPGMLPPGPQEDDLTSDRVSTGLLMGFMLVTVLGAVITAIALAITVHRARQPAAVGNKEERYEDEVQLVTRSSEPDDERDGVRHRVSEQTLLYDSSL